MSNLYRNRFFFLLHMGRNLKQQSSPERGLILSALMFGFFEGYQQHMKDSQQLTANMDDYWKYQAAGSVDWRG